MFIVAPSDNAVILADAFPVRAIPPFKLNNPDALSAASDLKNDAESIPSTVAASTAVRFAPLIAGNVPVMFAAGILVKLAADIAGKVPVMFAAGIFVKFAALIAGKVPVRLAAGKLVKLAPLIAGKAPVSFDAVSAEILASATVPVKLPAGIEVKLAALAAGKVEGNLASGTVPDVKLLALKAVKSIADQDVFPFASVVKN